MNYTNLEFISSIIEVNKAEYNELTTLVWLYKDNYDEALYITINEKAIDLNKLNMAYALTNDKTIDKDCIVVFETESAQAGRAKHLNSLGLNFVLSILKRAGRSRSRCLFSTEVISR